MTTCKVCRIEFTRTRPLQKVCGLECAVKHSDLLNAKKAVKAIKADRHETKQKLDAMQTHPQLVKKAQTAFNGFVRARDEGKPCISCGKPLNGPQLGGAFDCGHYRSVGSAPHMRFVEDNAHGQCKHCNMHLAGNHVAYRLRLIERIGLKRVEQLESDQTLRKYTREGLIQLAAEYREMTRRLKK